MQGDPFTMVIALDKSGNANGELYVDDGKSYQHEKGFYYHVQLNFTMNGKKGVFKSKALEVEGWGKSVVDMPRSIGGRVERILLVAGGAFKPKSINVGSKALSFKSEGNFVEVKDPKVEIGKEWQVDFEF